MRRVLPLLLVLGVACTRGRVGTIDDGGSPDIGTDAGPKVDGGPTTDGGTDGGPNDGRPTFGGPGPWPSGNVTYGYADGIQESSVVGVSTDERQNLWVATNSALYLLKPGDKSFHRYDARDGLHLPGNPVAYCDSSLAGGDRSCPIFGAADPPGISEITAGGPDEVFVGYYSHHDWGNMNDGTWDDPYRHTGKLDRVRLKSDGSLEVVRFDMVAGNSPMFWHNKTVWKMAYDHFIHPHELYVGTDHGVDKFSPDKWKPTDPGTWFNSPQNNLSWMSDHLHPQACLHAVCDGERVTQMLGDWRGLAIDGNGDLWVAGRWAAGQIKYTADNSNWFNNPRNQTTGEKAFGSTFGDPYYGNCSGNAPVFCPPQEGDPVALTAVTVAKDGRVWWSSGAYYGNDPSYGIAVWNGRTFTYYDPVRDAGMTESNVRDMVALPDGRLVLAGPNTGLVIWDPASGKHTAIRAGQGIPDDRVYRIEVDSMVDPPALHVATAGGAAVLRVLP